MTLDRPFNRREADVDMAEVKADIKYLVKEVDKIQVQLEKDYVTQDQLEPIKKIVYGLVGTMLIAVVTALMAIILRK